MDEHIMVTILIFDGAKHDSEFRIARNKMVDQISVKVCTSFFFFQKS